MFNHVEGVKNRGQHCQCELSITQARVDRACERYVITGGLHSLRRAERRPPVAWLCDRRGVNWPPLFKKSSPRTGSDRRGEFDKRPARPFPPYRFPASNTRDAATPFNLLLHLFSLFIKKKGLIIIIIIIIVNKYMTFFFFVASRVTDGRC